MGNFGSLIIGYFTTRVEEAGETMPPSKMTSGKSYQSPIGIKPKPPLTSGKSFKYETFWEELDECRKVVEVGWTGSNDNH